MNALFYLVALLPWLLFFLGAVYLIRLWKRPGPEQLHRAEVEELREQVSLMRDFIRDAMERIRRLEEGREPVATVEGAARRRALTGGRAEKAEPGDDVEGPPGPEVEAASEGRAGP